MLAGYLPFDDDPANPEGDNINLLYKYIVSTPLTFPEYVTPHARDLLRRILVPDPRKRADLFEVARHSWLADYAKLVEHVTSSATTVEEIAQTTIPSGKPHVSSVPGVLCLRHVEDPYTAPTLGRSASVREPSRSQQPGSPTGLISKHAQPVDPAEKAKQRDEKHKRATLQVEYVEPRSSTARGETTPPTALPAPQPASVATTTTTTPATSTHSKTRARGDSMRGPVEVPPSQYSSSSTSASRQQRPATQSSMQPPPRPGREPPRAVSDVAGIVMSRESGSSGGRPSTAGTMDRVSGSRLPSRGNSYGQAVAPTVAPTNAEGRFSQPKNSGYIISGSMPEGASKRESYTGRPLSQQMPADFQLPSEARQERSARGHRRSNTMESFTSKIFGRSNSRRQSQGREEAVRPEKLSRAYPPMSLKNAMPQDTEAVPPRPSSDSRRPSFSFNRKTSDYSARGSRRFSFLPSSFSRMSFSAYPQDATAASRRGSLGPSSPSRTAGGMAFGRGRSRSPSQSTTGSSIPVLYDSQLDSRQQQQQQAQRRMPQSSQQPVRGATAPDLQHVQDPAMSQQNYSRQPPRQFAQQGYTNTPPSSAGRQGTPDAFYTPSQSRENQVTSEQPPRSMYPSGFNDGDATEPKLSSRHPAVLQKNRKFGDAYETGSGSSSGGARRVMDWFRKRGKDRSG